MFLKIDSNVCRACLGEIKHHEKQHSRKMMEDFNFVTLLDFAEKDLFPQFICTTCENSLNIATKFKRKAISSENKLRSMLAEAHKNLKQEKDDENEELNESIDDLDELTSLLPIEEFNEVKRVIKDLPPSKKRKKPFESDALRIEIVDYTGSGNSDDYVEALAIDSPPIKKIKTRFGERKEIHTIKVSAKSRNNKTNIESDHDYVDEIPIILPTKKEHDCYEDDHNYGDESSTSLPNKGVKQEKSCADEDGIFTVKRRSTTKQQNRYFNNEWLTTFPWIKKNDNRAYCKFCGIYILCIFRHLQRHEKTMKHTYNVQAAASSSTIPADSDAMVAHFKCEFCNRLYINSEKLLGHLKIHEKEGNYKYKCSICSKKFQIMENIKDHMKKHVNHKARYNCLNCTLKFPRIASLVQHMKQCEPQMLKTYDKCQKCSATFNNFYDFYDHMHIEHDDIDENCWICDKHFVTEKELRNHLMEHDIVNLE